jgi:hypothetical protein
MSKKISEMLVEIAENEQRVYDAGERKGYEEGYADGSKGGGGGGNYDEGYKVGYDRGHKEGYDEGFTEGEDAGYEDGKTDGYADGYAEGHEAGEDSGYATGKADGLTEGVATGKAEGIEIGRSEGYENGKTDGIEIGKQAEYDAFWDGVTDGGKRTDYVSAFRQWGNEYIRPNIKITPTAVDSKNQTFNECKNLKKIEAQYFDFSQTPIGTRENRGYYYTFSSCDKLEEIEDIGMQADFAYRNTFSYCYALHTIAKIRAKEDTTFVDAFRTDSKLRNIAFDGVIGQNINFQWSTKLSADSIRSIMEHLSGTASGKTLTLSKTAVENAEFGDGTTSATVSGAMSGFIITCPILVDSYRLKVTLEVAEGHHCKDKSWGDSLSSDEWYVGMSQGSVPEETEMIIAPQDPSVNNGVASICIWFRTGGAVSFKYKVRAVEIDDDGNEIDGTNLYYVSDGTYNASGDVTYTLAAESWESLKASKPNWTISLV